MPMDHSQYNYVPFEGRPNVWLGYHLGVSVPYSDFRINPMVLAVARALFRKAPMNTYVFTGPQGQSGGVANFYRCTVMRDGEDIGFLAYATGRKGASVMVANDRISKDRIRGNGMVTSDVKRATALAIKKFLPTTSEEALMKDYYSLGSQLREMIGQSAGRKRAALSTQADRVMKYLDKNWAEKGQQLLADVGVPPSDLDALNTAILASAAHDSLRARMTSGLTFVYQRGETLYAVPMCLDSSASATSFHQRSFLFADAPEEMREKIGMLKVLDGDTYYSDVGSRLGDNAFMIFFDLLAEDGNVTVEV
jgi:hypothetical protein